MKSAKAFILLLVAFYACLFFFDWLKVSAFPLQHHSFIIWAKTFFLVVVGSIIMKLTLEKNSFKNFAILYVGLWLNYFGLKFGSSANLLLAGGKINVNSIFFFYISITQIITPFPFIAFWIFNRVYLSKGYSYNQ